MRLEGLYTLAASLVLAGVGAATLLYLKSKKASQLPSHPSLMRMSATKARILAFGDSLTQGWMHMGSETHPYSIKLTALLKEPVDHIGHPGWTSQDLHPKLLNVLAKNNYTHCLILSGTNDLAEGPTTDQLFSQITALHSLAFEAEVKTMVITIPQAFYASEVRDETNERLREFAKGPNSCLADLNPAIPYVEQGQEREFWDDHLHFSARGYDQMAVVIYEAIKADPDFLSKPFQK
eukprot:NODE_1418_length_867_cov_112.605405_g1372_i0.p1 GENE.NODE_1418_length_867_cov_112.605405_g1372_i0~~NODE_1418_length_867_cov_112.605405_g1372_i0.p1  ORF type:complete len:236 (+),score=17.11 NODE_1418_length_867_cov_112.605405_g1372_i0:93-800(+)